MTAIRSSTIMRGGGEGQVTSCLCGWYSAAAANKSVFRVPACADKSAVPRAGAGSAARHVDAKTAATDTSEMRRSSQP